MISDKERLELDLIIANIKLSKKAMIKKYLKKIYSKILINIKHNSDIVEKK
ncbi:hypothetical protein AVCANL279_00740 [Campylobacter canadensis]|nr:hypothetical protein [Campylobacter canadensis]MBZ7995854.1 hypothetical protein [Campylobacter canadensis]